MIFQEGHCDHGPVLSWKRSRLTRSLRNEGVLGPGRQPSMFGLLQIFLLSFLSPHVSSFGKFQAVWSRGTGRVTPGSVLGGERLPEGQEGTWATPPGGETGLKTER